MKRFAFLSVFFLCFGLSFFPHEASAASQPVVSVKLINYLGNQSVVTLTPSSNYTTTDLSTVLKANTAYTLKLENGTFNLYTGSNLVKSFTTFGLTPPNSTSYLDINGKQYQGNLDFTIENSQYIRPVNTVPLEEYVAGVVPYEMPASWNLEALKSQAVAARTYALNYIGKTINDTVSYQVYGGYNTYTNSNAAVQNTYGQTLRYNGSLINAVFSSSNGGYTESSFSMWGSVVPYLIAKQDSFDPVNPFTFTESESDLLANASLMSKIQSQVGTKTISSIDSIGTKDLTDGQRPKYVVFNLFFIDGTKQAVSIATDSVRSSIGGSIMKSDYISAPVKQNGIFTFNGKGFGHGVGMSQYGAKARGDMGQNYQTILGFYYSGAVLTTEY